jgi:hypothetical protein
MIKDKGKDHPKTGHEGHEGPPRNSFLNLGARREWVVNGMPWLLHAQKDPVPIV